MRLSNVVIVLCKPSEPGNVGAVCRAMKNCGLAELRLVAPQNMSEETIRARTVHAQEIWENARHYEHLRDAIADCALVIGTTRRRGKRRKLITMTARQTARYIKDMSGGEESRAALVFGNERTGLETEELALCNIASHIPAHDAFPSLNLSHSVQIYAYELYLTLAEEPDSGIMAPKGEWQPVIRDELDTLAARICDALATLGFYTHTGREQQEMFFRDIFARAGLTPFEADYMYAIFAKAARLGLKGQSIPPEI